MLLIIKLRESLPMLLIIKLRESFANASNPKFFSTLIVMHNKDRRQLDEHMGEDVEHGPYCCMHHCICENMGLVGNVNIFSQN